MIHQHSVTQVAAVNMCVDLRGGYGFMPQHLLNGPEVSASLNQVSGKGVAEGMRTDGFCYPDGGSTIPDNVEHHNPCQPPAPPVQKEDVGVNYCRHHHPALQVIVYLL